MTQKEMQQKLGEQITAGVAAVFEPEREADRLQKAARRARNRILLDDTRNKLHLKFSDPLVEFSPDGQPWDHLIHSVNTVWVTHMVPADHCRKLVNPLLTMETIIHDQREWALITCRVTTQHWYPYKCGPDTKPTWFFNAIRPKPVPVVTYNTYVVDRTSGERSTFCFSHYTPPNRWVEYWRWKWQSPIHPLKGINIDCKYDEEAKKFSSFVVRTQGSEHARAGGLHLHIDDTGYNARLAESYAGFADPESALVFLCHPGIEYYNRRDMDLARRDMWQRPAEHDAPITIGRLLSTRGDDDTFDGVTGLTEEDVNRVDGHQLTVDAPDDHYPWICFWDLMRMNRERRLHSVLIHRGPTKSCQFMPPKLFDQYQSETHPTEKKYKTLRKWFNLNAVAGSGVDSIWNKPQQHRTEAEYAQLWREGKYT